MPGCSEFCGEMKQNIQYLIIEMIATMFLTIGYAKTSGGPGGPGLSGGNGGDGDADYGTDYDGTRRL